MASTPSAQSQQSGDESEDNIFNYHNARYQRAAALLPSLVQLTTSLQPITSDDNEEAAIDIWNRLKLADPSLAATDNGDQEPTAKWRYCLADSTPTSYRRIADVYKLLRTSSEARLFSTRSGPQITELSEAIDVEAQMQSGKGYIQSKVQSELFTCVACESQNASIDPAALYHELSDNESVRLLLLQPGRMVEPISVQLRCAKLVEAVSCYETLSYSWHEDVYPATESPLTISCNGVDVLVQPTLAAALRRLRGETSWRILWIDALCIDQTNIQERGQQVKMMSSIYQNATRTVVWLGETHADGISEQAFGLMCGIINAWYGKECASFRKLGGKDSVKEQLSTSAMDETEWTPDIAKWRSSDCSWQGKSFTEVGDLWASLTKLFGLSWWHRKWVIQEVALSRSVIAMWQNCEISWYWIGLFAAIAEVQGDGNGESDLFALRQLRRDSISNAYLMLRLSRWGQLAPVSLSFLHLLRLTMSFDTGDPRDSVFALLGLQTRDHRPLEQPLLPADYSLTIQELFSGKLS